MKLLRTDDVCLALRAGGGVIIHVISKDLLDILNCFFILYKPQR